MLKSQVQRWRKEILKLNLQILSLRFASVVSIPDLMPVVIFLPLFPIISKKIFCFEDNSIIFCFIIPVMEVKVDLSEPTHSWFEWP